MAVRFYLTDAGKAAVVDQANLGLSLNLKYIAVGSGQYDASLNAPSMTALVNEFIRSELGAGLVDSSSGELRITGFIESTVTRNGFEIGLFSDDGILFAVAASNTSDPLINLANNVTTIIAIAITVTDVDASSITVVVDSTAPLALAIFNQHESNADPHPQYLKETDFSSAQTSINADITALQTALDELTDDFNNLYPRVIASGVVTGADGTVDLSALMSGNDLRDGKYVINLTPEGMHEAWLITRAANSFTYQVWNRSGTNRIGYNGNISYTVTQSTTNSVSTGNGEYTAAGTYTVGIGIGETKRFTIVGAGGAGGGSSTTSENLDGSDGNSSYIQYGTTKIAIAGAGKGGGTGVYTDSSDFTNGTSGAGGTTSYTSDVTLVSSTAGIAGTNTIATHEGGQSVVTGTTYGAGGDAADGKGTTGQGCGGAGGSGSRLIVTIENTGTSAMYVDLVVGAAGTALDDNAEDGMDGYAKVQTVST